MSNFTLLSDELGAGGYGKVVRAKNNATGALVAAKLISTSRMKVTAIQKEVALMERLRHPNIIGILGKEENGKQYIIYMELAGRGELFSRVISSGSLTEDEARPYFGQLMAAVQYMHANGVVHRDLKLENVLLDASDSCKVCDFGLAHVYDASELQKRPKLREVCGSKSYCAPEVLDGRGYDGPPTDVWSCGICLFAMLAGFFPLDEASGADWRFERVKLAASQRVSVCHTIFGFYERRCTLSQHVTDLIDGMLVIEPATRLTVEQVVVSPWLTGKGGEPAEALGAVYRSAGAQMDPEQLRLILAQESDQPLAPLYRGGPAGKAGPPPMLCKQTAFGADFTESS